MLDKKIRTKKPINTALGASKVLKRMILDNDREHFVVLNLNARNVPISAHVIAIGTANACLVHPREVFTKAIRSRACSMIVAHNHPSGELDPSEADFNLANRLKECGKLIGIEVIDNMVMDKAGNYRTF